MSTPGSVRVGGKQGLAVAPLSSTGLDMQELVCPRTGESGVWRRDLRSTTCL